MSVNLTIAGQTYVFPTEGEDNWGQNVTAWATAVSTYLLQRTGGAFTLSNDVDFGASFATIQAYLKSRTANIATASFIRMAKTDAIAWRNNANNANLLLSIDGSDNLLYNGNAVLTSAGGSLTANRALITNGSGVIVVSATTAAQIAFLSAVASAVSGNSDAATYLNKSLTDANVLFINSSDSTKKVQFALSGITTGTTRIWTFPDAADTFVGLATTQTLTNKTISGASNTISNVSLTSGVTGILPVANGGTNLSAVGSAGTVLTSNGSVNSYQSLKGNSSFLKAPTIQKFTAGGAATYTTPSSPAPLYIRVRMVGGGGGGAGGGISGTTSGGSGQDTTFGTSLLVANAGTGGNISSGQGGVGGSFSLGGASGIGFAGSPGGNSANIGSANLNPGMGGCSYFGGGGAGGYSAAASAPATNSGSGGGGGGTSSGSGDTGPGGGSGGFVDAIIPSPSASYSVSVGVGGSGGNAGTSGFVGTQGATGMIEVTEFYQ